MRAMTWFDHETGSVWSQPWGLAIDGAVEGTRLTLIPAGIMPWDAWLSGHPGTLVLDAGRTSLFGTSRKKFSSDFVIGIALGEAAKAYPFVLASQKAIINDHIGPFPVVVLADPETKAIRAFLRIVGQDELAFTLQGDTLVDQQTGSTWDIDRGIAVDGPLRGEVLQRVPYITSFDWAWEDFYPHTEFYRGDEG